MPEFPVLEAGAMGVTVLEGATSEALSSVADGWFESHSEAKIHGVTLQASPVPGGPLFLLIVHNRLKRAGHNGAAPLLAGFRRY
jgi:hypothetical protein